MTITNLNLSKVLKNLFILKQYEFIILDERLVWKIPKMGINSSRNI
jgi:hypothetical protein